MQAVDGLLSQCLTLFRAGDHDGAARAAEQVLATDPSHPRALVFLEYIGASRPPRAARLDDTAEDGTAGNGAPSNGTSAAAGPAIRPVEEAVLNLDQAPGSAAEPGAWDIPSSQVMAAAPAPTPPVVAPAPPVARPVQTRDANADGLSNLWDADAEPVSPPAAKAHATPWDEGPSTSEAVVINPDAAVEARPRSRNVSSSRHAVVASAPVQDLATQCAALMQRVKEHHALGDFSGSLELVEKVLELNPNNSEAKDYLERNEDTLLKMYQSKLGSLEKTPRLMMSPDQIIWLNLHHKAGFVLSRVDGMATFEDILSLSAMPRLEATRILAQLVETKVIRT